MRCEGSKAIPIKDKTHKLKAANGQEIGRSEYYSSKAAMENGIESVKKNAPDAEVVERQV